MSERISGLFVTFDKDLHEDDVFRIIDTIKMIKNVIAVDKSVLDPMLHVDKRRVRQELGTKIVDLLMIIDLLMKETE